MRQEEQKFPCCWWLGWAVNSVLCTRMKWSQTSKKQGAYNGALLLRYPRDWARFKAHRLEHSTTWQSWQGTPVQKWLKPWHSDFEIPVQIWVSLQLQKQWKNPIATSQKSPICSTESFFSHYVGTEPSVVRTWSATQAFRYNSNAESNKNTHPWNNNLEKDIALGTADTPVIISAINWKCYHCTRKCWKYLVVLLYLGLVSLTVQTCGNDEAIQFSISASGTLHGLMESTHKRVISDRNGHMCACPRFGNCIAANAAFMSLNCMA